MASVYNTFTIKLDNESNVTQIKKLIEDLIYENGWKILDEILVWEDIELSGVELSSETSWNAEDGDCETSRDLFIKICKAIVLAYPDEKFMGKHTFDYSSTDAALHMLCFYRDNVLLFYRAEVVDDVGCMQAGRDRYNYKDGQISLDEKYEYDMLFFDAGDEVDNDFMSVMEGYDFDDYPEM